MGNVAKFPYKISNSYKMAGFYKLYDATSNENGRQYSCFIMNKKSNPPAAIELAREHVKVVICCFIFIFF
jgi:hypothetical protein